MQGLFGRFGKKTAEPEIASPNYRNNSRRDREEIEQEYPSATRFDDDEETNWDDAETLENENNPILRPQPIVPAVAPPAAMTPDPDNWDEALPAATVKNSNHQAARRGKQPPLMVIDEEDIWDGDLRNPTLSPNEHLDASTVATTDRIGQAVGLWTATIRQFRRILPAPLRKLSDPLITAIVVALVTVTIWFVDSFALPGVEPSVANPPLTAISQPNPVAIAPQINPEQAFIEAIQTQLNEITSQYPDAIVQGLQVDTAGDRLIVRLDSAWYTLDVDRQNDLTAQMWHQAKANHFTKLEIQDTTGNSLARSPVVGRDMIILRRYQS